MEEDIKILEEQLNTYKRHIENYQKEECLTRVYYELKSYATALENLIKGYRELEEKCQRYKESKDEYKNKYLEVTNFYLESVPYSTIKEKIEEDAFEVYTRECGNIEVVCTDSLYELMEDK